MIKLIATDMDGTFLRPDMSYDEVKFSKIYQELKKRQIRFVVASGNQYFQLKSFFEDYPEIIYISENGAYIRDTRITYQLKNFDDKTAKQIIDKIQLIPNLKFIVCGAKSAYVLSKNDSEYIQSMKNYYHHLTTVDSFNNLEDWILKFSISCPPDQTDKIVDILRIGLNNLAQPTSSGHGDIDLIQPGINKASGLKTLGKIFNIDSDEMMAFGDGGNDLEMLNEVGCSVAMANAQENILSIASQITSDNQSQGVLQYIEEFLRK